ncbi:MAG: hypothetical protein AAGN82_23315, partial [Myxococcota bacterium]
MNQNPYQAPVHQAPYGAPAPLMGGMSQSWEVGEVLGLAWERLKAHWPVLVMSVVISQVVSGAPGWITSAMGLDERYPIVTSLATTLYSLVVGAFLGVGFARIFLKVARGQSAEIGELFGGGDRFLTMLAVSFMSTIAVLFGMLLLFIPGIILALGLSYASWYVADTEKDPVECLKASWEATDGFKINLFLLGLAGIVVVFVGLLCLVVGVLPAVALLNLAVGFAYLRNSGRFDAAATGGVGYGPGAAAASPGAPAGYAPVGGGGVPAGGWGAPAAGGGVPAGGWGAPAAGPGQPAPGGAPPGGWGPPAPGAGGGVAPGPRGGGGGFGAPPGGAPPGAPGAGGGWGPPAGGSGGGTPPGWGS